MNRVAPILLISALLGLAMTAAPPRLSMRQRDTTPIAPQVPAADRHAPGRIFLEQADSLRVNPWEPGVQILTGNVTFRRGDMFVYCDSARFYTMEGQETDSMEAFGNIRMEQGDTLFLYGDEMEYSGYEQLATIYGEGRDVRLINRTVTLTAPVLHYSMAMELGYYDEGGKLTDERNTLVSLEGEYAPPTKEANFYNRVRLNGVTQGGDSVQVKTDTLFYNTVTHIAELPVYSHITGRDGDIRTTNGIFDTERNVSTLLDRSLVHSYRGNYLTGDSIVYDRDRGFGEAFGSMILTDSARNMRLEGDYGFYNELTDSAYVTGRARAMEYGRPDTLYLHGREIRTFIDPDSVRLMVANPDVRFWRVDLQGVCDSLTFVEADTTVRMDGDPIVWSDNKQIFGGRIIVHLNDSTLDWADLPAFAFTAEQIDDEFYNQLSGKSMHATFADGELRTLELNGSVQAIMLPQEEDSTYNKIVNLESSYLNARFAGRDIEHAVLWPETSGTVTPLYLAKKNLFRLPQFKWEEALRPRDPDDIFPPEETPWSERSEDTPQENQEEENSTIKENSTVE